MLKEFTKHIKQFRGKEIPYMIQSIAEMSLELAYEGKDKNYEYYKLKSKLEKLT